MKKEVDKN